MRDVPATDLAWTMRLVRDSPQDRQLPMVSGISPEERLAFEEENVRKCFSYARKELSL
jgi:hypothetical protein